LNLKLQQDQWKILHLINTTKDLDMDHLQKL